MEAVSENEAQEVTDSYLAEEDELTERQRQKLEIDDKMIVLYPQIKEAEAVVNELKDQMKEAKSHLDSLKNQGTHLMGRLHEIEHGNGQLCLPLEDDDEPEVSQGDPGSITSVYELDITDKQAEALEKRSIYMVSDLEEKIRFANTKGMLAWYDTIVGIGPEKATDIENALESWRKENPIPTANDTDEEDAEGGTD